jgi:hypothetical protein
MVRMTVEVPGSGWVPVPVVVPVPVNSLHGLGGCPKKGKRASLRHILKALIDMSGWKKWKMLKMPHPMSIFVLKKTTRMTLLL